MDSEIADRQMAAPRLEGSLGLVAVWAMKRQRRACAVVHGRFVMNPACAAGQSGQIELETVPGIAFSQMSPRRLRSGLSRRERSSSRTTR